MSFDKEKTRRAAEKHLSQGKIQAAVREYSLIAEHDPKDFNSLNMLGDLYVRLNANKEAIQCFERIAEYYNTQGFAHKAIAIFKKILRLQPDTIHIAAKIAPLYQSLGLIAEARLYYLTVADNYQRNGQQIKALDIWSRIADLDPNDTATRLKLAESYVRENESDLAVEAFVEAGNRLLSKKQTEEAVTAFNRALELSNCDAAALTGATNASLALGFPDEAADRLEKARAMMPDDIEILSLLTHSYIEAENGAAAETAVLRLVERDPTSFKQHLEVVRLYLKANQVVEAARVLNYCGEILLSSNQEEDLLHWAEQILARDPEQLTALKLLTRVRAWQRNEEELKNSLERLAEAAALNHRETEERDALIELAAMFPEDENYAARLRELGGGAPIENFENSGQFKKTAVEMIPTFESFNDFDEVEDFSQKPPADVRSFESVDEWRFESNSDSPNSAANHSSAPPSSSPADDFGMSLDSAAHNHYQAETAFAFVNENQTQSNSAAPPVHAQFSTNGNHDLKLESNDNHAQPKTAETVRLERELESVDFYISESYTDLAIESLNLLEAQYGKNSAIDQRRQRLETAAPVAEPIIAPAPAFESNDFEAFDLHSATTQISELPPAAVHPVQPIEIESTAFEPTAASSNANVAATGFEDLFAELGDDLEMAALPATQTADYETHYNLGLAYKEMALQDDAVEEFQSAVKLVTPGDGTPRYLQCCHLIGHCFMEKAMPKLAAMWFQRGLDAPGHTDEEYQALRYELGTAYEKADETDKALEQFAGIYAVNVAYRDIGTKIRTLQTAR